MVFWWHIVIKVIRPIRLSWYSQFWIFGYFSLLFYIYLLCPFLWRIINFRSISEAGVTVGTVLYVYCTFWIIVSNIGLWLCHNFFGNRNRSQAQQRYAKLFNLTIRAAQLDNNFGNSPGARLSNNAPSLSRSLPRKNDIRDFPSFWKPSMFSRRIIQSALKIGSWYNEIVLVAWQQTAFTKNLSQPLNERRTNQ